MLVCIGGFPGSGRNRLASDVLEATGWHYASFISIKRSLSVRRAHVLVRPSRGTPYSDELLNLTYKQILGEFPMLSKMYPDAIVGDNFSREAPRELFFKEAEKYFGRPMIIWADSSIEESEKRMKEVVTDARKLETRLKLSREMRQLFQPFTRPVLTVRYLDDSKAAVQKVVDSVKAMGGSIT